MSEGEDKQRPSWLDDLTMESFDELSPELLLRLGSIFSEVGGTVGETEEKQINELLTEYNKRLNDLIDQKRREKT
jgi:hypothetical protein